MRHALLLLLLLVEGCQCPPPRVAPTTGELRVQPTRVDFGPVALGGSVADTVEVENTSRAPATVTASVEGPFDVSSAFLEVGGGASVAVRLHFTPTSIGPAQGLLHLAGLPDVELVGTGLAACQPTRACASSTFDLSTRGCAEGTLPEGTACQSACLTDGACRQGLCVGALDACDDGDRCTIDACAGDGGCLRVPLECAVTDPCRVALCDSRLGWVDQPLQDGTPCGPATCATATFCLNGTCQTKTKPDAAANCTYTEVTVGNLYDGAFACAKTRGGAVRCWGKPEWRASARWAASPEEVPELASTHGLVAGPRGVCGILEDGGVLCVPGDGGTRYALSAPATQLTPSASSFCALLVGGAVECSSADDNLARLMDELRDAGPFEVTALSNDCVLLSDGGLWTIVGSGAAVPFSGPIAAPVCGGTWIAGALLQSGAFEIASPYLGVPTTVIADAGVRLANFGGPDLNLVFEDGGLDWLTPYVNDAGFWITGRFVSNHVAMPPLAALAATSSNYYREGTCALTDGGDIYCWGTNLHGELGDRSVQPAGQVLLSPGARIDHLVAISNVVVGSDSDLYFPASTLALSSGNALSWGNFDTAVDGGTVGGVGQHHLGRVPDDGELAAFIVQHNGAPGSEQTACVLSADGGVSCWGNGQPLVHTDAGPVSALAAWAGPDAFGSGAHVLGAGPDGLWLLGPWFSRLRVGGPPDPLRVGNLCIGVSDGGVNCLGGSTRNVFSTPLAAVELPGPAYGLSTFNVSDGDDLDGACAALQDGTLWCWDLFPYVPWVAGRQIPGAPFFARQVVGTASSGCALYGVNGVKCWGENRLGQLGRDGLERSDVAVDVSFSEPVRSLSKSGVHTCALTTSGKALCWGLNHAGELGFEPLLWSAPIRLIQ